MHFHEFVTILLILFIVESLRLFPISFCLFDISLNLDGLVLQFDYFLHYLLLSITFG
jgi:hypothetical protein